MYDLRTKVIVAVVVLFVCSWMIFFSEKTGGKTIEEYQPRHNDVTEMDVDTSNSSPGAQVIREHWEHHPLSPKKCLKNVFEDVLLVIIYHFAMYDSIPLLKELYHGAFPHIIICGPEKSDVYDVMVVEIEKGYWGYECLGKAARENPNFRGYLYINDDMIVNWWNLAHLDRDRIWQGSRIMNERGIEIHQKMALDWPWWSKTSGFAKCKEVLKEIEVYKYNTNVTWNATKLLNNLKINGEGSIYCLRGWSDFFYIPGKVREAFSELSSIFFKRKLFLEIAVPMMESLLGLRRDSLKMNGVYLPGKYGEIDYGDSFMGWMEYNLDITFMHPFKFHGRNKELNKKIFENWIVRISKELTNC